ncbi:MAG: PDDEXK nuclease domain-containing protein [Candidatus Caenarcaniphilales bacterium]|jgi:predicted nuclease of restriction endonuclease-like (RecB) superfamily|nr:PDDEXK nuclease domain-containing protein [Candidatus Caenarcaniphilales bacterium]
MLKNPKEYLSTHYKVFLQDLKSRVRLAQHRASLAVNKELIILYWNIGNSILEQQSKFKWGSKIIDNLSKDLKSEFPEMKGFSLRNLKYMRAFAKAYPELEFVQAAPAQITWSHNTTILDKAKSSEERTFYINSVITNGWSQNILVHQMESCLYQRQFKKTKIHNFHKTLPDSQSDLANEILKDPYQFDFLTLGEKAQEKDLEKALVEQITKFLLELGAGFAFLGKQHHLEISGQDFYLDLLFYHTKLHCYVVIELKHGQFKPEYLGKLNFYLSAVDEQLKTDRDNSTIGIILCKDKNKLIAEYALRDISKPIGISEYNLAESLSKELQDSLPNIQYLENELKNI